MPKVLFLGANARDTTRLRLNAEVRDIRRELQTVGVAEVFHLVTELSVRPIDLQSLLLEHAADIIHFSGHGSNPRGDAAVRQPASATGAFRELLAAETAPLVEKGARGGLLLEDQQGAAVAVRPDLLAALCAIVKRDVPLRCVVLNACFTSAQAEAIAEHVDCVIGTASAIDDEAAIAFATAFYRAIAHGKSVGTAFELGCIEIGIRNLPGEDVPRLFHRPGVAPESVFLRDDAPVRNTRDDPSPGTTLRSWSAHWAHVLEPAQHFQGRERLREELGAWLTKAGDATRVVAVCAIGGAGKTALVDRILRDWFDGVAKAGKTLQAGVFVWSFYENDRVDDFLGEACRYFTGDTGEVGGRITRLSAALKDGLTHLLVLDGLETVQTEQAMGRAKGELIDPGFRVLIRQIAAAQLGQTRMLLTSRFPLCDVASWEGSGYRRVDLEDLDPRAARAVLRAWGVRGEESVLDALAERVGWHALSVRVMSAFLKTYADGDGTAGLRLDLDVMAKEASDADKKALKLDKLLGHLSEKMPATERELMARLSLFHRGISADLLAALADAGGEIAGALIGVRQERLLLLLRRLVAQGLAFTYGKGRHLVFTAHPFLRDHFKKLGGVKAEAVHEVLRQSLAPSLEKRPGQPPRDAETLDRYEALIEHTLLARKVDAAFELFQFGMGGGPHLGFQLGDYRRLKRIVEAFSPDGSPERCALELSSANRGALVTDWALSARNLGALVLARHCLDEAVAISRRENDTLATSIHLESIAGLELLRGRLAAMTRHAEEALDWATRPHSHGITVRLGYHRIAAFLTGKLTNARQQLDESTCIAGELSPSVGGVWEATTRIRLGDRAGALEQIQQQLAICERMGWDDNIARLHILLGQLSLPDAPSNARHYLALSRGWATRAGHLALTLRAHLLAAAIDLHQNRPDLAYNEASEGLLLADTHDFGLLAIDLLLSLARSSLARHSPNEALRHATDALNRSTHPECGYAWGEADALHLIGLAHRDLGQRDAARKRFRQAADIRARIEHPEAEDSLAQAAALQGVG